jgi:hypothetical protein
MARLIMHRLLDQERRPASRQVMIAKKQLMRTGR